MSGGKWNSLGVRVAASAAGVDGAGSTAGIDTVGILRRRHDAARTAHVARRAPRMIDHDSPGECARPHPRWRYDDMNFELSGEQQRLQDSAIEFAGRLSRLICATAIGRKPSTATCGSTALASASLGCRFPRSMAGSVSDY